MNNELIKQAKKCKSAKEILSLAKEKGFEMSEAEAQNYFAMLNKKNGELADGELNAVSGGGCYSDDDEGVRRLIVTSGNSACADYDEDPDPDISIAISGTCAHCKYFNKKSIFDGLCMAH